MNEGSRPTDRIALLNLSAPEILQRPAPQLGAPLLGAPRPERPCAPANPEGCCVSCLDRPGQITQCWCCCSVTKSLHDEVSGGVHPSQTHLYCGDCGCPRVWGQCLSGSSQCGNLTLLSRGLYEALPASRPVVPTTTTQMFSKPKHQIAGGCVCYQCWYSSVRQWAYYLFYRKW